MRLLRGFTYGFINLIKNNDHIPYMPETRNGTPPFGNVPLLLRAMLFSG